MEEKSQAKKSNDKLYRSKIDRILAGVCGGIAEYFNVDPLIVRLGWVIATLFAGAGIIAYIASIFIIPENPEQEDAKRKAIFSPESSRQWGIILIVLGSIFLFGQLGGFHYFYLRHFQWQTFLAILLVSYGIYLLFSRTKPTQGDMAEEQAKHTEKIIGEKSFYRISEGKMLGGVCTGLAYYFNIDVTIIRLIWVLATLASGGLPIVGYLAAMLIFPTINNAPEYQSNGGKNE